MTGGHGHVTPRPDGMLARCGGPVMCAECAAEQARKHAPGARCLTCRDTGHVCEDHPSRMWGGMCCDSAAEGSRLCEHGACCCGAAGIPCPACCPPVPQDGTRSLLEAFTPGWRRASAD